MKPTKNNTADFKDGELIKALVHHITKGTEDEFDLEEINKKHAAVSLEYAISLAMKIGIPKFFSPFDILNENAPNEKQLIPWLLLVKAHLYQRENDPQNKNRLFQRRNTFLDRNDQTPSHRNLDEKERKTRFLVEDSR